MERIQIITDSHSSISQEKAGELGIVVLPMPFMIDHQPRLEGCDLSREDFFTMQEAGAAVSTSQPAPADVTKLWDEALREHDTVLHMPISSGISGTCATAQALAQDRKYQGRVFVVDHGRVATPLYRAVLDALELAAHGMGAQEIKDILERNRDSMNILVAVDTLEYLRRGGRISAASSVVGTALNIKPVLHLTAGELTEFKKCHGMKAARRAMILATQENLRQRMEEGYTWADIHMLAATSADEATTAAWLSEIREAFPEKEILCEPLSLGICCHTGKGALGIGYSCSPS